MNIVNRKKTFIQYTSLVLIVIILGFLTIVEFKSISGFTAQIISPLQQRTFAQCIADFSIENTNQFNISEILINSDDIPDGLIHYTDNEHCGSAGCIFELCISTKDGLQKHIPFGFAAKSLTTKETTTNGMHDLILNNDTDVTVVWNGYTYVLRDNSQID